MKTSSPQLDIKLTVDYYRLCINVHSFTNIDELSMDKSSHDKYIWWWDYFCISKLQRLHCWSLEIDKQSSHITPYFIVDVITYPCWD